MTAAEREPSGGAGCVVIVEDDPDMGQFLRIVLEGRGGLPVRLFTSPADLLAALPDLTVDAMLTDIQMPGMSGLELVDRVRRVHPMLPIAVMTAFASVDYAVQALRRQADEFLVKPVASAELVTKMRTLAERGAAARRDSAPTDVSPGGGTTRSERQMVLDLATLAGRQAALDDQLAQAAQVQRELLPQSAPRVPGYDLAGACLPSFSVGGDFYDWYAVDGGLVLTVADVMGKGIGAAILTATVRAVLRGLGDETSPATLLQRASAALGHDLDSTETFVTAVHARLDAATGDVRYADAGHGLTLVVRPDGGYTRAAGEGLPLGVLAGDTWSEGLVHLDPGDTLVAFSDGLFDLLGGGLQALDQVAAVVTAAADAQGVLDRVASLARDEAPLDDLTVVVVRRSG
ncbi:PP2C family protein-serine/threonine phosphatase [uncultured Cellulomonas sp.]|uniref:PP2C family protein-serine/threonine phosphatase n=1 Tax=uncultured Cellulomonas sp. TaxID=189682 RepID=UPI00261EB1D9|nr:SpoIIE family protein phosphatase [uncultured Cellulomonas sp.]